MILNSDPKARRREAGVWDLHSKMIHFFIKSVNGPSRVLRHLGAAGGGGGGGGGGVGGGDGGGVGG